MAEHMNLGGGGGGSNVHTLTDHFKQALNATRTHLQAGPSALSSAAQMGLRGGGPNAIPTFPPPGLPQYGGTEALYRANQPLGAGAGTMAFGDQPPAPPSGLSFAGFWQTYGWWLLLGLVLCAGVAGYFWWRKKSKGGQAEAFDLMQRPLNRSGIAGGGMGPVPYYPTRPAAGPLPPPPPSSPQPPPTLTNPPEQLRGAENQGLVRGAEWGQPNIAAHTIPMSTRVRGSEPTPPMPPQDVGVRPPPPQPVSQPPAAGPPLTLPISAPPPAAPTTVPNVPVSGPTTTQQQPQNNDPNFMTL